MQADKMRLTPCKFALAMIWFALPACQSVLAQNAKAVTEWDLKSTESRAAVVKQLHENAVTRRERAWNRAAVEGWSPKGEGRGYQYELQAILDDRIYIYQTANANAAISTAANQIRNTAPYNVNGTGITVGVWDGGAVRSTHQELAGRLTVKDGAATGDHATHVGGTIGAAGVVTSARGMAPSVRIDSYEWNDDASEMASRGMAAAGESGKIQLSNHSYGYTRGWDTSTGAYKWYGVWGQREDAGFGQYDSAAQSWDTICYNAPYYLPCKSAGNDRNDNAPSSGTLFSYYNGGWQTKTYAPATDPYSDGFDSGGFDCIGSDGIAKNILTVGAVDDAVSGGARSLAGATMADFSSWGPADDGRIKPDVVGNGVTLYSSLGTSDTSYDSYSGTSMATPNVCGSAALLNDYYGRLFPGQYMRASTLKGLIIQTADDLGNSGPDYKYGWGLVNMKVAADLIKLHYDAPSAQHLAELSVSSATTSKTNSFAWDGTSAIRVTLCWTDPAGALQSSLDDSTRVLVNDLDLRIVNPLGQVYLPYVLAPGTPDAAATTGDNNIDNVEQVYIASPGTPGTYRAVVSLHGILSGSSQVFSVILSGSTGSAALPPTIAWSSPLPSGTVNVAYNQTLTAIGGTTPYVWTLSSGSLPDGMSLSSGGVISGTPGTAATATFTVRVKGNNELFSEEAFSLTVNPVQVVLFTESFENAGSIPSGWSQAYVTGTANWTFQSGGYGSHPASAHGGSYNALLYFASSSDHKTRLVAPMIDFGAAIQNAQLTFWHCMALWSPDQDELRVYYKTSVGGSWTLLASYASSVASWTQRTISLPNPNSSYYIAFEGNAKYGYGVCIDDVQVAAVVPTLTVTFDAQGGTAPSLASKSVTYGLPYGTLATSTRTGYTLAGWWTGAGGTGTEVTPATTVTVTAAQTLYAKWTPNTYVITQTVGANGSSSPVGAITVAAGGTTSIIYTANEWFRVAALTNDTTAVPAAVDARQYTNSLTVLANRHVQVYFKNATANQAGLSSTVDPDWAKYYYSNEADAADDGNLATDYLLGLNPLGVYAIGFAISSIMVNDSSITVAVRLKDGANPLDTTIHGTLKLQGKKILSESVWSDIGAATISDADFDADGMCNVRFTDATNMFYKAVITPYLKP